MNQCEVCGRPGELHHIIFRSASEYMKNVPVNHKYLCNEHHRTGKDSPHMNRKVDLRYKLELQNKLYEMLSDSFYNDEELQKVLLVSRKDVQAIVKRLRIFPEGYDRDEIIVRCMGGRLYAE